MGNIERWGKLIELSEQIGAAGPGSHAAPPQQVLAEVRSALLEIDVMFPRSIDPVDDLEGYCVRRFSKAMLAALDRLSPLEGHRREPFAPAPPYSE